MTAILITAIIVSLATGALLGMFIGASLAAGARADLERRIITMRQAIQHALIEATDEHNHTRQITEATFQWLLKINAEQ